MVLLHDIETVGEGERLIREIVKDSADADGAKEAFLAVAGAKAAGGFWKEAVDTYREAIEIWPDMARMASVQEGRGWALQRLGRREDALEAFRQAGALAKDEVEATAMVKKGDVLSDGACRGWAARRTRG